MGSEREWRDDLSLTYSILSGHFYIPHPRTESALTYYLNGRWLSKSLTVYWYIPLLIRQPANVIWLCKTGIKMKTQHPTWMGKYLVSKPFPLFYKPINSNSPWTTCIYQQQSQSQEEIMLFAIYQPLNFSCLICEWTELTLLYVTTMFRKLRDSWGLALCWSMCLVCLGPRSLTPEKNKKKRGWRRWWEGRRRSERSRQERLNVISLEWSYILQ